MREDELRHVVDELVDLIEQRESADPDAYDWTVDRRIRRLEVELARMHRRTVHTFEDRNRVGPTLAGII
ncbi:MAG: hypothetical protein ACJ77N_02535 [Chloroflexota bacterium]